MTISTRAHLVSTCLWIAILATAASVSAQTPEVDPSVGTSEAEAADDSGDETTSNESKKEEDDEPDVNPTKHLQRANELAGRNAITRSIPHYEKALRAAPEKFPSAYYNLANVWKAKEEWGKALLHFQAYRAAARTKAAKKEAREAIDKLSSRLSDGVLSTLTVDVEPETGNLYMNGFLIAREGDLEGATFYKGEYTLRTEIEDYHPAEKTVTLEGKTSKKIKMEPQIKTFYGKVKISVDQEEATVKLHPKDLKSPKGPDTPVEHTSPVETPVELVTGKYLLEVTKKGFHRWVRYIDIRRDREKSVRVEMSEKLPEEIR